MKRGLKKDFTLLAITMIPIGVAINVVAYQLMTILKMPIYLDVIGTCIVAMVAGPWVGLVTGGLGNVVNGMLNPVSIPFAITSMAIGLTAGYLSKYGMLVKPWRIIISGLLIAVVSSATSSPIQVILFGGVTGQSGDIVMATLLATGKQIWTAVFSQTLLLGVVDKVLAIVASSLIVYKMTPQFLSKMHYGDIYMHSKKMNRMGGQVK
ncbi:ECF transporter S component [Paenibacillus dakarensis]|uniref:ECF transporter S component n=1 Tax=Paenibacillus dakarensis TaxID=1527293 RepID=UPI0006D54112|nr:ECF transporter S component [Paenibacillus dakarensis]